MRELGVLHDSFTFPIVNQAVLLHQDRFSCGKTIHCLAIRMGFGLDVYFCNTMLDVYVKCGEIGFGAQLFDQMCVRDLVSWTTMISGFVREGNVCGAFGLFNGLRMEFEPNYVCLMVMFQVCCRCVNGGRQLHGYVVKCGLLMSQSVLNSVLKMYSDSGCIDDAEVLFGECERRDVVSWNIMISFYSLRQDVMKLADCVRVMQGKAVLSIESLTLLVSSFSDGGNIFHGKQVHCLGIKSGQYDSILKTSLLDFYAKCEDLDSSEKLFSEIPFTNLVTLNAMMSAFIRNGYFREAIELFQKMLSFGWKPAAESLTNVILAYSHMGSLRLGKSVHAYCFKNFLEDKTARLETSIMNMYIRCGSIFSARICFDRMPSRDLVAWTSMIEGFGTHGMGYAAIQIFHSLIKEGVEPNSVTFLAILSACSHSGLLRDGCKVFYSMKSKFGIEPNLSHYTCIVDLLGRFGMLKEALAIILKFVDFADSRIWGALLSASRIHENQLHAEFAAGMLFKLEPENAGYHTLLSNVQASLEGWSEVEEIRDYVQDSNLVKQPGWSCIEAKGLINGFVSGDRSHPQVAEIYETLCSLSRKLQDLI
ncbi:Pentatricopeptide repeat-containing protein [Heracleum sosnowskyi]|uniref:Pentatricopeptide repeat-containing protein n=1 Tax=Heracleum sosnowskyi TaxID=360622 RepID=A0AAD8J6J9_9APIA|nr:Pentatricopeptide repeat-containing protein [Heracleum sosnowskyi]